MVAARIGFRSGAHRCRSERGDVVAERGFFTGREGDVHVVIEDAEGESELGQLPVGHHHIRLKMPFRRTHAREIDAVARFPVVLAQVLQMQGHHRHVCAPLFEADQYAHADLVHPGLPHAVEAVHAPFEFGFHPRRVVDVVVGAVVGLLKADHPVESGLGQAVVILARQRHYLDGEVVEIGTADLERLFDVIHARCPGIFSRYEQQVFERSECPDRLALVFDLFHREDHAVEFVMMVESAVDAGVRARVGDIHRNIHRNSLAEPLLCVSAAQPGHRFQVGGRCR